MKEDMTNDYSYNTLRAIEARKAQLRKEIRRDSDQMAKLRRQLFSKPTATSKKSAFMPSTLVNKGASVLDGLLLAWKLYRKFKK